MHLKDCLSYCICSIDPVTDKGAHHVALLFMRLKLKSLSNHLFNNPVGKG